MRRQNKYIMLLATVLCFSLLGPFSACAQTEPSFGVTLTPGSTSVPAESNLTLSYTITGTPVASSWIGLYKTGASDNAYTSWQYAPGANGSLSFSFPTEGTYELRYFKGNTYDRVAVSQPLTVTKPIGVPTAVTLTLSSSTVNVGTNVSVTYSVSGTPVGSSWIGLYKTGASDNAYTSWQYAPGANGALAYTLPTEGTYEFRFFKGGGYDKVATSQGVTAIKPPGAPFAVTFTFSTTSMTAGDPVTISYVVQGTVLSSSWIGLYKVNAPDNGYSAWSYAPAQSGSATLVPPSEGTYELRYFKGGGYDKVATSQQKITVKKRFASFHVLVTPSSAIIGETAIVSWGSTNTTVLGSDWIGLFESGTENMMYLKWKYTLFRGGETPFVIEEPGVYEFRYMRGMDVLGTSSLFSVTNNITNTALIKNYPPKNRTIVAFGDSLTQGVGAPIGSDYVTQLSQMLGTPIINAGVSRNTTAQALERLQSDVLDRNPGIVIVFLGGNDLLQNIPTSQTTVNLQEIITRIQASGAVVVLVGVQGGLYSDRFQELYRTLAQTDQTVFIPNILRGIIGNFTLLGDLVHPNAAGYKLVAQRILPSMQQLLVAAH